MIESFSGKTVVITGAGRGIGREIAEEFAAAGANVMIGARTMSYAEEALAAIRRAGGTAEAFQLDVKDKAGCIALINTAAARFGGIDVVIHSAADIAHGGLGHVSDEALEAGIASIAKAAWWLLEAARPHLAKARDGGRFIAISSVNGPVTIVPEMTAYAMAKSALDAFIRGAALDLVEEGITVNAVVPGFIASARATTILGDAGVASYGAAVPVGRAGTAGDIAHACFFLASARASYVTGANVKVDGGATISTSARGGILDAKLKLQRETV
jgi:3-oxoacyl-[acyl-carrier protein] reductase